MNNVLAYLDPGSGGLLLQGLVAAVAAIYLGAVSSALVWLFGVGGTTILAAIVFYFLVTVIVTAIVTLLIARSAAKSCSE